MKRWLFPAFCLLATLSFSALGVWQVERRIWKVALIDAVDKRVHAPPVSPPTPPRWRSVNATSDAYRRVTVHGFFGRARDARPGAHRSRGRLLGDDPIPD